MEITIYKTLTGKIVKTLSGPTFIVNCLGPDESYLEGVFPLNGTIVDNEYIEKVDTFPNFPADSEIDALSYLSQGDIAYKKALQNIGLSEVEAEQYLIDNYKMLRSKSYPSMKEHQDAQVKLTSTNEAVQAEGRAQLDKYYTDCLAVKARFPKPDTE